MPYKTKYGSHYHMTLGCHGADIPCDVAGLEPCSDCCNADSGGSGLGGSASLSGSGSVSSEAGTYELLAAGPEDADGIPAGFRVAELGVAGLSGMAAQAAQVTPDAVSAMDDFLAESAYDAFGSQEQMVAVIRDSETGAARPVVISTMSGGRFRIPRHLSQDEFGQVYDVCQEAYEKTIPEERRDSSQFVYYYNEQTREISFGHVDVSAAYELSTGESGGMSLNLVDASTPTGGYMVAADPQGEADKRKDVVQPRKSFPSDEAYRADFQNRLSDFASRNADILTQDGMYLGTWLDPESGICYFDLSECVEDLEEAKRKGAERNEISVWDIANMCDISTGGDGSW